MQKSSKIVLSVSVKCCKKHNVTGVEGFCSGFYRGRRGLDKQRATRAHVCVCAQVGSNRGRMRTRAQVGRNRGVRVRVRASILAQAQVRTTGRARVCVRAWVRVRIGLTEWLK